MKSEFFKKNRKEILAAGAIILGGNLLGAGLLIYEQKQPPLEYLERNAYGSGAYEENLRVETKGEEQEVKIWVEEQQYTEEERQTYIKEAKEELDVWLEEEMDKSGAISQNTEFPKEIPDNPVQLSWEPDNLEEAGEKVRLMCFISLGEEMEIWEKTVLVYPEKGKEGKKLQYEIQKETDRINTKDSDKCYLPKSLGGEEIIYRREQSKAGIFVCLYSFVLGTGVFAVKNERERQEKQKKLNQMQLDYPDIIERLILFLKAGFSIRKSMEKLATYYLRDIEKYHRKKRYAYEEIVRTCKEIESGIYEKDAYERMGKRCMLPEYKVLSVLLIQNLQRGNRSILELLEREAVCARDERRRRAKVKGEEASTKLLLPMVLQLIVVVVILMVPAFLSFM